MILNTTIFICIYNIMYLIGIITIMTILILYLYANWNTSAYESYLYGFWVAENDDFCEDSDIESMLIFIGEPTGIRTKTRLGYIIVMNDICNQGFEFSYVPSFGGASLGKYTISAHAKFDDEQLWTEDGNVTLDVDMLKGTLKIHNDGILYARLHKQHDTTNVAHQLDNVELLDVEAGTSDTQ